MSKYIVTIQRMGMLKDAVRGIFHYIDCSTDKYDVLKKDRFMIETKLSEEGLKQVEEVLYEELNTLVEIRKLTKEEEERTKKLDYLIKNAPYGLTLEEINAYLDGNVDPNLLNRYILNKQQRYLPGGFRLKEVLVPDSTFLEEMNDVYKKLICSDLNLTIGYISSILYFSKMSDDFTNVITLVKKASKLQRYLIAETLHDDAMQDHGVWITEKVCEMDMVENEDVVSFFLNDVYESFDKSDSKESKLLEDFLFAIQLNLNYEMQRVDNDTRLKELLVKTYILLYEVSEDSYYLNKVEKLKKENEYV